jgi:hypothetical protein
MLRSVFPLFIGCFFSFLIIYIVGRTPWTGDQLVARPLPAHRTTQTQNKHAQTSMPEIGLELTISVFERVKCHMFVSVMCHICAVHEMCVCGIVHGCQCGFAPVICFVSVTNGHKDEARKEIYSG